VTAIRAEILATLRAALAAGGTSAADLARRAELSPKTIRRLRAGHPVSARTLELLADALGIAAPLDGLEADLRATIREVLAEEAARDSACSNVVQSGAPITDWRQASIRLGVSRWTLWRHREAAGDTSEPWWADEAELRAWYARIRAEGRRRDAAVTLPESPCDQAG
jgi:transcriptional regulator with XRE-family HTH domain